MGNIGIGLAASLAPKPPLLAIRNASVVFPSARKPTGHARLQSATKHFQLLSTNSFANCLVSPQDRG